MLKCSQFFSLPMFLLKKDFEYTYIFIFQRKAAPAYAAKTGKCLFIKSALIPYGVF
jgi:hypothetical protein